MRERARNVVGVEEVVAKVETNHPLARLEFFGQATCKVEVLQRTVPPQPHVVDRLAAQGAQLLRPGAVARGAGAVGHRVANRDDGSLLGHLAVAKPECVVAARTRPDLVAEELVLNRHDRQEIGRVDEEA